MKCNIFLVIITTIQSVIISTATINVVEINNNEFDTKIPNNNIIISSLNDGDIYTRHIRDTANNIDSTALAQQQQQQTSYENDDRQSIDGHLFIKSRKVRKKNLRDLFFGVLLPSNLPDRRGSKVVLPAIELALGKVQAPGGLLEGFNITMDYRDTMCSSVYGPLAAFELYTKRKPDAFFGPICDYVLAPISRYSGVWEIPILTAAGLPEAFSIKVF